MTRTFGTRIVGFASFLGLAALLSMGAQEPAAGRIARNTEGLRQLLIGPMEPGDAFGTAGWRMSGFVVKPSTGVPGLPAG